MLRGGHIGPPTPPRNRKFAEESRKICPDIPAQSRILPPDRAAMAPALGRGSRPGGRSDDGGRHWPGGSRAGDRARKDAGGARHRTRQQRRPTSPRHRRPHRRTATPTGARVAEVLRDTLAASLPDRVTLTAAGCAFYATLALFPAISMLISVYGLAFNPLQWRAAVAGAAGAGAASRLRADQRPRAANWSASRAGSRSIGLRDRPPADILECVDRHEIGALGAERGARR